MNAIILFSHGSLLCGSGEALEAHAARLRTRGLVPIVEVGYLNYSEPPFAAAVEKAVGQGAQHIVVAPYFLVPGKFVRVDLPKAIAAARAAHPKVEFHVADPIGYDDRLADALIASAHAACGPEHWRDDLNRATLACRSNPSCPLYSTPNCPKGKDEEGVRRWALGVKKREEGVERLALSVKNLAEETPGEEGRETPNVTHLTPRMRREGGSGSTPNALFPLLNAQRLTPNALLVMVHGSPRPVANEEMFRVVEAVKRRGVFPTVAVGFLECNAPSISEAVDLCVTQGAATVLAVPYFLHTGSHVADDLPMLLEEAQERHPGIDFRMGAYLGRADELTDILADRVKAQQG